PVAADFAVATGRAGGERIGHPADAVVAALALPLAGIVRVAVSIPTRGIERNAAVGAVLLAARVGAVLLAVVALFHTIPHPVAALVLHLAGSVRVAVSIPTRGIERNAAVGAVLLAARVGAVLLAVVALFHTIPHPVAAEGSGAGVRAGIDDDSRPAGAESEDD